MNLRQAIIATAAVIGCAVAFGVTPSAYAHDQDGRGQDAHGQSQSQAVNSTAQSVRNRGGWRGNSGRRDGGQSSGRSSTRASIAVTNNARASDNRDWRGSGGARTAPSYDRGGYVRDSAYRGGRGRTAYVRPRFGPSYRFEWNSWRGGRWYHSWHGGVYAWWWVIGDDWFDYAAPVYPYPYPTYYYDDPVYEEGPGSGPYNNDAGPPPPPQQQQSWYYCENPRGYYPYVTSCPGGWRAVPATPPGNIQGE